MLPGRVLGRACRSATVGSRRQVGSTEPPTGQKHESNPEPDRDDTEEVREERVEVEANGPLPLVRFATHA